jgi:Bacterial Ig domain
VVRAKSSLAVILSLLLFAGCNGKPLVAAAADPAASEDPSDLTPPMPDAVRAAADGLSLSGSAPAGARVRLATPQGEALTTVADARGRWTVALGPVADVRILGLSATAKGRQIQSEGYVLVTARGQAAVLRAGAGARRIDPAPRPGLRAIDFDRGGGLEVSASAAPGATVILRLDGRQVAEGRTDAGGHYDASLPSPGSQTRTLPGAHQAQVFGDGFSDGVSFQVAAAAPLTQGPVRSQLTPAGLRVDWITPGGGVQSTILIH